MPKSRLLLVSIIIILFILVAALLSSRKESAPLPQEPQVVDEVPGTWLTKEDEDATFRYPQSLETDYIGNVDWPPELQVMEGPYICTSAGSETARAGETSEEVIDGTPYCVTKVSEGAAGSMYTQYAYARDLGGRTAILTFSLRFSQCANYPDEEKNKCEVERESFDISSIIHRIAETIELK